MRLVDLIECLIQQRDYETAVSLVQVCGDFASRNHPGIFVCHRLEGCLRKISESARPLLNPDSIETAERGHASEHALHIMTEAHPVGGSTRFVCRWIGNDTSRTHSVALNAQGNTPVPESLRNAVTLSGGSIYRIDENPRNKLDSAAHLRSIAGKADLVLLHIHPHDPLAILALSNWAQRPLTVFMNHADHLFWLGAGVADHYLAFRKSGYDICLDR